MAQLIVQLIDRSFFGISAIPTQGTSRGLIFQTIPEDFSLFVRLWASQTEEDVAQSWPMGLSGETVGSELLKSDSVKFQSSVVEEQSLVWSGQCQTWKMGIGDISHLEVT